MKFGLCKADRPMLRRIFDITWPAFLELVMSTLFGMVDMVMLGRLSPVAIAAAGLTNQPFMLLMAVFAAVNVGGTALVSWCVGAKNMDHARSVTGQLISVNFLIGLVVTVIGYFSAGLVVTFMGAQPDTKPLAIEYFQIVAFGLLFQAVTMAVTAALRGAGETKLPMVYNLGSNLLNIFGNYVLIFGKWGFPQMGVSGAALSTTIARGLACLAALTIVFFTRHTVLRIKPKNCLRFNREDIAKVFRIGLALGTGAICAAGWLYSLCTYGVGFGHLCLRGTPDRNQYLWPHLFSQPGVRRGRNDACGAVDRCGGL